MTRLDHQLRGHRHIDRAVRTATKKVANVVLGFPTLDGYLGKDPYFGCIVGRYANRIAKGKFKLNGKTYTLAINDGPNHMHGGIKSFSDAVWSCPSHRAGRRTESRPASS